MKAGRSLSELSAELERQAKTKKDYVADTRALTLRADQGVITLQGVNGGMPLRKTAHEQLGSALSIPKAYYDRMLFDAPDLLAQNANHWLKSQPQKRLVRTLDGGVRAILSDRYRPLDNLDLAEAVLPKLSQLEGRVLSGEVTESRFYLKASTPRLTGEVKKGDVVEAGLVISNSEIGEGALRVEELIYRLVCLNGSIHAQAVRQTHAGRRSGYSDTDLLEGAREHFRDETRAADDKALFLKVQDAVEVTLSQERFDNRLLVLQGASERKIEGDPVKVVEVTAKRFGLGDAERGSVLKHFIDGGSLTAWGLANAMTRASQDVDSYELATSMEAAGGLITELTANDFKALAL